MTIRHEPGDLFRLDPQAQLEPFGFDWTEWLAEISAGELIVQSTWSYTGRDALLALTDPSIVTGQLKTQVRLSHPTKGVKYKVVNHVKTNSGVEDDRTFVILGQDT